MTAETLSNYSAKDLAQLAKRRGVHGWHAMRKDQLVRALMRLARKAAQGRRVAATASRRSNGAASGSRKLPPRTNRVAGPSLKAPAQNVQPQKSVSPKVPPQKVPPQKAQPQNGAGRRRLLAAQTKFHQYKDLGQTPISSANGANGRAKSHAAARDRLVVMVRGPFWLHAYWELSRHGVSRAQAALGQEWHAAKPTLRLFEVSAGATTNTSEAPVRDVEIHGGVNNWYIDVKNPPRAYRLDIGYLAPSGKFFALARSNVVTTPKAAASDALDENWIEVAENFDKIYAMSGGYAAQGANTELQELFEERLRRPMGSPLVTQFGAGVEALLPKKRGFSFEVDAELLVFGSTHPDAHVTLQGEPVKLRPDGTFTMRFSLPNCRQVIPAVACSRDGFEQRTVVLAVERNTKTMEPLLRDGSE